MTWRSTVLLVTGGALVASAPACDGKWPASMEDQPSVKVLSAPRPAPEGAVPVGGIEVIEDREDVQDAENPLAQDPTAAVRGQRLFARHCAVCHGANGHGGTKMAVKFPPPPDLRYMTICRRTDGFLYGTITLGGRAMPPMREGLTSRERWSLVSHVRHIQAEGCVNPEGAAQPPVSPTQAGGAP